MTPHGRKIAAIVKNLLEWFSKDARDLPWRRTRDPYAIWVSEIMLQQTQVKTVLPYWERWMRRLPDVAALANAHADELHKLWEGLGYYTRVRNLQSAARVIVAQHGTQFPERFEAVLALPGIGRYTAGAICSIAFNQPTPLLDGNVMRVLTRLFGIAENPRAQPTNEFLWSLAGELVRRAETEAQPRACSALNQSLMELGALICTPRQPRCEICPVARLCLARRENRIGEIPNLGRRTAPITRRVAAFVVRRQDKFLVRQRPAGVVNAHLWEFPNVERVPGVNLIESARAVLGFKPSKLCRLCAIKHSITRYRITLEVFEAALSASAPRPPSQGRWLKLAALQELSFPSAHRKIVMLLQGRAKNPSLGLRPPSL